MTRTVLHDGTVLWRDRHGRTHDEGRPKPVVRRTGTPVRVVGPLERAWEEADDRAFVVRKTLSQPNPSFSDLHEDADTCLWTWLVQAPQARAVLLWINPVFDHDAIKSAELTPLNGSGLWTICLRLPASLRASYRIAIWESEERPPWQVAEGRREVIVAAREAGAPDPRAVENTVGPGDRPVSIAHGPRASLEPWKLTTTTTQRPLSEEASRCSRLDHLPLSGGADAWVQSPETQGQATPLIVLFDGRRWKEMGLPRLMHRAIEAGALPAVHLALLDVGNPHDRGEQLGVPGGQVDVLLDELLPRVRAQWNVTHEGSDTVVAGQSLGGIAALWSLALSQGEVGHAIAQSPSLWRFDVAEPLLAAPDWTSIRLQAGMYEGHMIDATHNLEQTLNSDHRLQERMVRRTVFTGGHDWAAWRAELVTALAEVLQDSAYQPIATASPR